MGHFAKLLNNKKQEPKKYDAKEISLSMCKMFVNVLSEPIALNFLKHFLVLQH